VLGARNDGFVFNQDNSRIAACYQLADLDGPVNENERLMWSYRMARTHDWQPINDIAYFGGERPNPEKRVYFERPCDK